MLAVCNESVMLTVYSLFVSLSVALLSDTKFAYNAQKSLEMILISSDWGRFVVMHPCSTLSVCRQLAPPMSQLKIGQNLGFWIYM